MRCLLRVRTRKALWLNQSGSTALWRARFLWISKDFFERPMPPCFPISAKRMHWIAVLWDMRVALMGPRLERDSDSDGSPAAFEAQL
jgi:hypothetical protein